MSIHDSNLTHHSQQNRRFALQKQKILRLLIVVLLLIQPAKQTGVLASENDYPLTKGKNNKSIKNYS